MWCVITVVRVAVHYIHVQRFSGLGEMWLLILHSKTSNDDEKPQVVVDETLRNR